MIRGFYLHLFRYGVAGIWLLLQSALVTADESPLEAVYAQVQAQNWPQALTLIEQGQTENSADVQWQFVKGIVLAEINRTAEAITIFEKLTSDHPDLPEPYNNLAVLYVREQRFESAVNALKRAIQTHPSYATAHENLGDLYARLASLAYRKAQNLDQENQTAQAKLALIQRFISLDSSGSGRSGDQNSSDAKSVSTIGAGGNPGAAAEAAVREWARAWAEQDVNSYIAAYAEGFSPKQGQTRASWAMQRRDRILRPEYIRISISDFLVVSETESRVEIEFLQSYLSDRYKDKTRKKMALVRQSGGWKILEEGSSR